MELSDHFTIPKMMKYTVMPIIAILFCSVYSVADGLFVANFTDPTSFAALNIMANYTLVFSAFGFMTGAGGSALIGKDLGEKSVDEADRVFAVMVQFTFVAGIVLTVIALILLKPFAVYMGAENDLLSKCIMYGRIMLIGTVFFALQMAFQSFCIAKGEETKGLIFMLLAGATNIVLDALFIVVFKWGIAGSAVATVIGQIVGTAAPLIMFLKRKEGKKLYSQISLDPKLILNACSIGFSEMLSILTTSIVSIFYQYQLLKLAGEAGVDAYGVILYVMMLFSCIFMGYGMGMVPVVGYHYGAGNKDELHGLLRGSLFIVLLYSLILLIVAECFADPLSGFFVDDHRDIFDMTVSGFRIYSISLIFTGINMFLSSFFTALGNGRVSAALSAVRTLVLPIVAVLILPAIMGTDGVWFSAIVAEGASLIIGLMTIRAFCPKYSY